MSNDDDDDGDDGIDDNNDDGIGGIIIWRDWCVFTNTSQTFSYTYIRPNDYYMLKLYV